MKKGWHNEPRRHSLAAKGIKTTCKPQKNIILRNYGLCTGCGHALTEPNYCSYCQGVDKIESGVGVKGNENKEIYIVKIDGEVKARISAVNEQDARNQWEMLKTMVKGGKKPYTINLG